MGLLIHSIIDVNVNVRQADADTPAFFDPKLPPITDFLFDLWICSPRRLPLRAQHCQRQSCGLHRLLRPVWRNTLTPYPRMPGTTCARLCAEKRGLPAGYLAAASALPSWTLKRAPNGWGCRSKTFSPRVQALPKLNFVARFRVAGRAVRLHERSRFVCEANAGSTLTAISFEFSYPFSSFLRRHTLHEQPCHLKPSCSTVTASW